MGRASQEQAARNRERVVAAACRLFRMHGVENVSIADVMTEAGLTPGGFYKQFESKDALVNEAFALAFSQSSGRWKKISHGHETDALAALAQHYFMLRPGSQNCPMLAFSSLIGNLPSDATATGVYDNGVETLYGQFREAASASTGRDDNPPLPEADTAVLFAAMVGAGLLGRTLGQTALVRQIQAAVLAAFSDASGSGGSLDERAPGRQTIKP